MNQADKPKYATLFYDTRAKLEISWAEYALLEMVYHLSHKTGYCYKTASSIAYDLGLTKRAINIMIGRLVERGLMDRLTDNAVRVTEVYYLAQVSGKKVPTESKTGKSFPKVGKKLTKWEKSTPKNNNENNKEDAEAYERARAASAKVRAALAQWKAERGR